MRPRRPTHPFLRGPHTTAGLNPQPICAQCGHVEAMHEVPDVAEGYDQRRIGEATKEDE